MRKSVYAALLLAVTVAVAPACASRGFVRTEVGNVNAELDGVSATVEKVQERVGQAEARIGAVDQKAEAAGKSAAAANAAAKDARAAADKAATSASNVGTRLDEAVAAAGRLILTVTLNEAQGNFATGRSELPDEARAQLDQLVNQLRMKGENVFLEIEGHTDNTGGEALNQRLGLARAEAVKQYLYEQHQVPLHKMNVVSYGESRPVAPNNTRDGRAQNRRVVVRVLS